MSKRFNKAILIVALSFAVLIGQAFAYKYVMNDGATFSYVFATTQITALTGGDFDDGYFDYALGDFDFYYYGRKVTHMRISTNGYIVFGFGSATGAGTAWSHTSIPDNAAPEGVAAVNWADWDLTPHGTMWYDVIGTAPTRTLVIEWRDIPSLEQGTENYRFEVIFYETSNEMRFQYEDVLESTSHDFGNKSTVGVEHPTSLQAEQFSFNSPDLSDGQAILFTPFVHVYGTTDFNGDGTPDGAVYRPSDTTWYVYQVQNYAVTASPGDIPVPGDYDGDGDAYPAMFTPSTSTWHTDIGDIVWGTEGDIPVPADYDGDGVTDIVVWRPSDGRWYVYGPMGGVQWGAAGDIPFPIDRDGDGSLEFVVWRPSDGRWYVYGPMGGVQWGEAGDIPVQVDVNGDGIDEFVVWRPSDGQWYVYGPMGGWQWGLDGDVPVPADIDGDGMTDSGVWRPDIGRWFFKNFGGVYHGVLGDIPMIK